MGYLELADGIPDFPSAVMSLWFRVPAASIAAATDDYAARDIYTGAPMENTDLRCVGIIPLITFGEKGFYRSFLDAAPELAYDFTSDTGPSMVGIRCGPIDGPGGGANAATLYCRLEMNANGQWTSDGTTDPGTAPADSSDIYFTDNFEVGGQSNGGSSSFAAPDAKAYITVTPDEWHHVLLSFDVSNGSGLLTYDGFEISGFGALSEFNWAFDDEFKSGASGYLYPGGAGSYGGAAQGIFSERAMYGYLLDEEDVPVGTPLSSGLSIPTEDSPVGIPTIADYATFNYNVIMAEVQIFTGVTLDTSVEANRRAFVTGDGRPASPALAADLLGKQPEIYFQSHADWIAGINRGTADGAFEPTGTINTFTPTP